MSEDEGDPIDVESILITWPEGHKTVSFESLVVPLRKALEAAYELKRRDEDEDIVYHGYDIGRSERATCLSPTQALSAEYLKRSVEDQGRDAADVILGIAVQLGIEQGRRIVLDELDDKVALLRTMEVLSDKVLELLEVRS